LRIELIRRPEHSLLMSFLSPVLAIGLTLLLGFIIFAVLAVARLVGLLQLLADLFRFRGRGLACVGRRQRLAMIQTAWTMPGM